MKYIYVFCLAPFKGKGAKKKLTTAENLGNFRKLKMMYTQSFELYKQSTLSLQWYQQNRDLFIYLGAAKGTVTRGPLRQKQGFSEGMYKCKRRVKQKHIDCALLYIFLIKVWQKKKEFFVFISTSVMHICFYVNNRKNINSFEIETSLQVPFFQRKKGPPIFHSGQTQCNVLKAYMLKWYTSRVP